MYYAHICIIVYMCMCAFISLSISFPHATLQLNIQLQSDNNCVKISVEHKSVETFTNCSKVWCTRALSSSSPLSTFCIFAGICIGSCGRETPIYTRMDKHLQANVNRQQMQIEATVDTFRRSAKYNFCDLPNLLMLKIFRSFGILTARNDFTMI